MYCVSYVVKDWYDSWLMCRHDASFTGACFDTLAEIKEWAAKNLTVRGYITEILDLRTGKRVEADL